MKPNETYLSKAQTLVEALPYIQQFRGATFVIKYGGSAMENEEVVERLLRDIVFLEAVGINPVVVHGGGKAITRRLSDKGVESRFVNGLRVTNEHAIGIVSEILDSMVNPTIVEKINLFGGQARGFSGCEIFRSRRLPPQPDQDGTMIDIGYVGEVCAVEVGAIRQDIKEEIVSVVSPLSVAEEQGETLNVNADNAAAALASELRADKMIYLSDVPGILQDAGDESSLIPSVTSSDINRLVGDGIISGGMLPKVKSAKEVLAAGVSKVHFIDGRIPHGLLLEVFTKAGVGTEILA